MIGAGPSGLSAAYQLARMGHSVTIKEAGPMPGGMMRFGIPRYRMPRDVLDAEVKRITDLGVTIEYNSRVARLADIMSDGGFDAAFLAVGAHVAKRTRIPVGEGARVLDAMQVLRSMEGEEKPHARPPRGGLRRRQHRHGRGAHGQAARRGRNRDRLPAQSRSNAGAQIRGRRGASRKAS